MAALSRMAAKSSAAVEHDRGHELRVSRGVAGAEHAIDFLPAELKTGDRIWHGVTRVTDGGRHRLRAVTVGSSAGKEKGRR